MDIGRITDDGVRAALEALRRARPLAGNSLLAMDAVRRRLAEEGLTDGEALREWALAVLLADIVDEHLSRLRQQLVLDAGQRTFAVERELLEADFSQDGVEREAWSCLYYRYFSPLRPQVKDLAAVAHAGAHDPSRYVRRRMAYGYTLLAGALRECEHAAQRDAATVGNGPPQLDRPGPATELPSVRTLPVLLTRFIGREREVADVARLLGVSRLVTLIGPGGCGKTRLAIEVAAQVVGNFPAGVCLAELGGVTSPALVAQTVANSLGVREGGRGIADALVVALGDRALLLVLDNCEQVVEATATLAERLLVGCPLLRILATSREALRLPGEVLWLVPPLSLPDPAPGADARAIDASESVRLFVDRAVTERTSFALEDGNRAAVAEICRRLEGMPLAIELAAARVGALSVTQIAARLDDSLRLLSAGRRTVPHRQQTLRATLDWSHDLLDPAERELWARLSVFRGGWTLAAAEAVASGGAVPQTAALDVLAGLVAKSIVVLDDRSEPPRYRLLETVRAYGFERLVAAGEASQWRDRHRAWSLELAERNAAALAGPEPQAALALLAAEHDNLRAALDWSRGGEARDNYARDSGTAANGASDCDAGWRLGAALWRFWWLRGHLTEGRAQLEDLLRACPHAGDSVATAEVARGLGVLSALLGDSDAARTHFETSLAVWRRLGNKPGIAAILNSLGMVDQQRGDLASARQLFQESLSLRRELGDRRAVAGSLSNLGSLAAREGDGVAAQSLLMQALAIARDEGDQNGAGTTLFLLAGTARQAGEPGPARSLYEESLAIWRTLGDRLGEARVLLELGLLGPGDDSAASRRYLEQALAQLQAVGDRAAAQRALAGLAQLAEGTAEPDTAVTVVRGHRGP